MGGCSSSSREGASVLPLGHAEIAVRGHPPPSAQVAPAPLCAVLEASEDGHSVTVSGLYYSENKNTSHNLVAECKKGNTELVQELLRSGADVNMKGMWGNTPLIAACQYGHHSVCNVLLECSGINVNAKNEKDAVALLYACLEGMPEICSKLFALGAIIPHNHAIIYNSRVDKSGMYTPLSSAITNGHVAVVRELLSSDTNLNINEEIIDSLQKIGSDDLILTKPVMLACACNQPDVIKLLVDHGASIVCTDSSRGYSVLHHACRSKACAGSILPILLDLLSADLTEKNINMVDVQSKSGDTALLLACEIACEAAVALLLEAGANVNIINNNGTSPLHYAVKKRNEEIVRLLLAAKANPNLEDTKGVSATHIADKYRDDSVIKVMIKDVVASSDEGRLQLAKERLSIVNGAEEVNGVVNLPLVPSMAALVTRDMLTGSASQTKFDITVTGSNDFENEKGADVINDPIPIALIERNSLTPLKGDDIREVARAAGAGRSVKSSDAPRKAASDQKYENSYDLTNRLNAVKMGPSELFGE